MYIKNITILTATFIFLISLSSLFPLMLLPGRGVMGAYLFCCISDITFQSLFILMFVSIFLVAISLRLTFINSLTFALSFALLAMSLMMNDLRQEFEGAFVKQMIYDNIGSIETITLYTGLFFAVACLFFTLGVVQFRKPVEVAIISDTKDKEHLKQQINHKIKMVIRQYDLGGSTKVYIPILQELQQEFFSDDLLLQEKGLKGLESLLLTRRTWGALGEYLDADADAHQDKFIDNFNDFVQWDLFLDGLVADAVTYHQNRT